jgi:hypothetical protein
MSEEQTTLAVQRYLDALAGDAPAEPIVRALLDRSVSRLQVLCANLLYRGVRLVASFRPVMRYARRSSDITRCSAIGLLLRRASLATAKSESRGTT